MFQAYSFQNIIDRMAATTDKVSMCLEILAELITD